MPGCAKMKGLYEKKLKIAVLLLCCISVLSTTGNNYAVFAGTASGAAADNTAESIPIDAACGENTGIPEQIADIVSYEEYMNAHSGDDYPETRIEVEGGSFRKASRGFEIKENFMNSDVKAVVTKEEGSVEWEIEVPQAGLYNLMIEYYPIQGKGGIIEREIHINGELPFSEARYIEFYRVWKDSGNTRRDARDNDIRQKQQEQPRWITECASDSEGYYTHPFYFYFQKGKNSIEIISVREPVAIGKVILLQMEKPVPYQEYIHGFTGFNDFYEGQPIKIQGEKTLEKSDSILYPIYDRTSPLTEPYHHSKIRMNTIGGVNWRRNGQWISWEFTAPEDGFYEIAIKYRQNLKTGLTVVRSFLIDGKIPFKEAAELKFPYKNEWQLEIPGENGEPYLFYFTTGTHTITLKTVQSEEMANMLRKADEAVLELNKAYRKMLMVIGGSPDTMRDYQLERKTPDALQIIKNQHGIIQELSAEAHEYAKGSKGSETAILEKLASQLNTMHTKPDTIAKQWVAFKDNITALGTWALSMKEQPLEIDYILVRQPGSEPVRTKAGFFAKLVHEIKSFFASFFEDYDSIGEIYGGEAIDIWVLTSVTSLGAAAKANISGSGRDQAQIIKDLTDNYFVSETGIHANVKLVNQDVLLSATLAGRGPDVALNVAGKEPVNYALRNAAANLAEFEDFTEVAERFHPAAFESFTLDGGVYAIPQTMSFHVMFYRADILQELGLTVPNTWEEFYNCLAAIQKRGMNIGIFPDYTTFAMFLYQHNGKYYLYDGKRSGLSSEEAVAAFKQWTSNYTNYRMPVKFEFANRFRTGEMPLAIGDYTNYNYLSFFAPEIKGLWGFCPVPGRAGADGELDRSVSAWVGASILLETSDKKEQAWEFLKWWMSEEIQTIYGNEIENILGVAGRVATANMNAMEKLPWTSRDYHQLKNQLSWVKGLPEVPGGYFTERHITNAFYSIYNNNEDPREILEEYVRLINDEIENKRIEFGLETLIPEAEEK